MKRKGSKIGFIIFLCLLLLFSYSAVFGISNYKADIKQVYIRGLSDVRRGIDIGGAAEAVFKTKNDTETEDAEKDDAEKDDAKISESDMMEAEKIMRQRVANMGAFDGEVYRDTKNNQIVVRLPLAEEGAEYSPYSLLSLIGQKMDVRFIEGEEKDGKVLLQGAADIKGASTGYRPSGYGQDGQKYEEYYYVSIKMTSAGASKYEKETARIANSTENKVSIWIDDEKARTVEIKAANTSGEELIGASSDSQARTLAGNISSGVLPIKFSETVYRETTPALGTQISDTLMFAGIGAFVLICALLIYKNKLTGFAGMVAVTVQVAGIFAIITKFFEFLGISSFTLTLPAIAGIIMAAMVGIDANISTANNILTEMQNGKTIDGSIETGTKRGFSSIINICIILMLGAFVLMGALATPNSLFSALMSQFFFMFGGYAGAVYAFCYTLFFGLLINMLTGTVITRAVLRGVMKFKIFRKASMIGGAVNV